MAYQYINPSKPRGWKRAVCRKGNPVPPFAPIRKSSSASPGRRISARKERERSWSTPTTRQKSRASPYRSVSESRRPRRSPGLPASRSSPPQIFQSQSAYHSTLAAHAAHGPVHTARGR